MTLGGTFGALFAGITGTAFCVSCLAPLFSIFGIGFGGLIFVLEYRLYFVILIYTHIEAEYAVIVLIELSFCNKSVRVVYAIRYMSHRNLEKVFIESFSEYGDAIFRFCMVKVSNVELAEDMTQEVFARYWQYLRDDKEMSNVRSFLYTIANNMAKDWYKKKKAYSLDEKIESGLEPKDKAVGPEIVAEYREILAVIEGMEEKDKEVLLLKHIEGLPPKEIAEVLGETANTVSVRINRATKRLQVKLGV